jgi:hypothetical protein
MVGSNRYLCNFGICPPKLDVASMKNRTFTVIGAKSYLT